MFTTSVQVLTVARKEHQFPEAEVTCGFGSPNMRAEVRSSAGAATALTAEPCLQPLNIGILKDSLSSELQWAVDRFHFFRIGICGEKDVK